MGMRRSGGNNKIMGWFVDIQFAKGARSMLLVAALGLACCFCSTWLSRNPSLGASQIEVIVTRFAMMGAFLGVAVVFREAAVPFVPLIVFAAIFLAAYILSSGLAGAFGPDASERVALLGLSSIFEGLGIAIVELVFLCGVARFDPWLSAVGISVSYLAADLLYSVFLFAPDSVVAAARLVGEFIALVAVVLLTVRPAWRELLFSFEDNSAQHVGEDPDGLDAFAPSASTNMRLAPAALFVCLLAFVWGVVAEVSGGGNAAFFDTTSEFVVIGVRLVIVVFCLFAGTTFTIGGAVAVCSLVWACGLLILSVSENEAGIVAGGLVVKSGLYALQALTLVVAARYAFRHPRQSLLAFGIASFALLCGQFSRFALVIFVLALGYSDWISLALPCAWWVFAAAMIVIIAMQAVRARRMRDEIKYAVSLGAAADSEAYGGSSVDVVMDTPGGGVPVLVGNTPLRKRSVDFCLKFEQFCEKNQLTERERDVLFEALHGRTVDGIADELFLSRDTVKTYLSRAYSRAGVGSKQAVLKLIDSWELEG